MFKVPIKRVVYILLRKKLVIFTLLDLLKLNNLTSVYASLKLKLRHNIILYQKLESVKKV